jgi:hypothetical protein
MTVLNRKYSISQTDCYKLALEALGRIGPGKAVHNMLNTVSAWSDDLQLGRWCSQISVIYEQAAGNKNVFAIDKLSSCDDLSRKIRSRCMEALGRAEFY